MEYVIDEKYVIDEEKDTKECDFREMTRMDESKRGKVKRLQAGTREMKRKEEVKKKTGTVLAKIVLRIQESLPEIQMEKAGKRFSSHARRMDKIKITTHSSQVETCQKLLDSLDMNGSDNDM